MRIRLFSASLVLATALFTISCDGEDHSGTGGGCSGHLATAVQSGNTINATGTFSGGQPIMRLTQNGVNNQIPAANYDGGTASFNIASVAKGQYTVTWILSCDNGDGEVPMGSSVSSITIN